MRHVRHLADLDLRLLRPRSRFEPPDRGPHQHHGHGCGERRGRRQHRQCRVCVAGDEDVDDPVGRRRRNPSEPFVADVSDGGFELFLAVPEHDRHRSAIFDQFLARGTDAEPACCRQRGQCDPERALVAELRADRSCLVLPAERGGARPSLQFDLRRRRRDRRTNGVSSQRPVPRVDVSASGLLAVRRREEPRQQPGVLQYAARLRSG